MLKIFWYWFWYLIYAIREWRVWSWPWPHIIFLERQLADLINGFRYCIAFEKGLQGKLYRTLFFPNLCKNYQKALSAWLMYIWPFFWEKNKVPIILPERLCRRVSHQNTALDIILYNLQSCVPRLICNMQYTFLHEFWQLQCRGGNGRTIAKR